MARFSHEKHAELEAFWRFHQDEWARGALNQREYCDLHGRPLKRFGNCRTQFKVEENVRTAGLLYRRGGFGHMASHMSDRDIGALSPGYIPSARAVPEGRRNFSMADKRLAAETEMSGASLSVVARRHGVETRLLLRSKQQMASPREPVFLTVPVCDSTETATMPAPAGAAHIVGPIIVERATHEIEVELAGRRRVRLGRDTNSQTVRAIVAVLDGEPS